MKIVLYGFLGCGGIAAAVYFILPWISKMLGGDRNIEEAIHKITQKIGQENIDEIEKKESIIKVTIDKKDELAKESIEKIKTIQKKAEEEIQEILKENKISKIHSEIDKDWNDL